MALPAIDDFSVNNFGTNWTFVVQSFDTSGGVARSLGVSADSAAYWSADAFNADHYAQARLLDDASNFPGVGVRVSGTSGANFNGYFATRFISSGNVIRLLKYTNGVQSQLGADFLAVSNGTVVKLQVVGTTLEVFYNDLSQGTRTDGAHSTGSAGLFGFSTSHIDDFQADNVSGGGEPTLSWMPVSRVVRGQAWKAVASGMTPPSDPD